MLTPSSTVLLGGESGPHSATPESIGIDDGFPNRNPGGVTSRDREVLGVDHLACALARLPPGRADDLIAGLRTLVDLATPKEE
jgi:hypothetical protein